MSLAPAGYSTRPLAQKLGYREGQRVAFVALPAELTELAEAVGFGSVVRVESWDENLPPRSFE